MNAPLRLYAADRSAVVGQPAGPIDPWLTRVVKLVPAEIVAVYLAGRPLAPRARLVQRDAKRQREGGSARAEQPRR